MAYITVLPVFHNDLCVYIGLLPLAVRGSVQRAVCWLNKGPEEDGGLVAASEYDNIMQRNLLCC